jgi:hypothetical protein
MSAGISANPLLADEFLLWFVGSGRENATQREQLPGVGFLLGLIFAPSLDVG